MQSTEGQRDGDIVIVVIASIFFAISYFSSLFLSQISDILFGDKSSNPVVVGIAGSTVLNGIYYVPYKARVRDLLGAVGSRSTETFDENMLL